MSDSTIREAGFGEHYYLWQEDRDGNQSCIGRVLGWTNWTSDTDETPEYAPIVAIGAYGEGAHAKLVPTHRGGYRLERYHQGSKDDAA